METNLIKAKKMAQFYIDKLQLPIIPCKNKKPNLKNWQKHTSTTFEELEQWLQNSPSMNIGLVLGTASQIVGIDIDGADATKEHHS